MWDAKGGGRLQCKNDSNLRREHRATYVRKLHLVSFCKYTHGVVCRLSWPHNTLPCVLMPSNMAQQQLSSNFLLKLKCRTVNDLKKTIIRTTELHRQKTKEIISFDELEKKKSGRPAMLSDELSKDLRLYIQCINWRGHQYCHCDSCRDWNSTAPRANVLRM